MRMPLIQFTVRRMMIAVAVLSVCLAAANPVYRMIYCLREADRLSKLRGAYLAEIIQAEESYAKLGIDLKELELPHPELWCGTYSLKSYRRGLELSTRSYENLPQGCLPTFGAHPQRSKRSR